MKVGWKQQICVQVDINLLKMIYGNVKDMRNFILKDMDFMLFFIDLWDMFI